jgi:WD40 repeat protein
MKSGESYEISLDTNSISLICEGHGYGELHALSLNQAHRDEYVTGGDDGTLRIWSLSQKRCLRKSNLGCAIRAVCWSPNGLNIVAGMGGDPKNSAKDGSFAVLQSETLDVIYEDRKAKKWISDIKFGKTVFVLMSRDGCLYVHDSLKFNLIKKIELPSRGQSGIVCGDFSIDFEYIRVGTTHDEVYYYSTDGELITSPIQVRNFEWLTHSCIYNWMIKGLQFLYHKTTRVILKNAKTMQDVGLNGQVEFVLLRLTYALPRNL